VGRKKISKYRIVAADSRVSRDGEFLETVGFYDPQTEPKTFELKTERVAYWIKQGAVPTLTVKNLIRQDRLFEKAEKLNESASIEGIERKAERKRKPKVHKKTASE